MSTSAHENQAGGGGELQRIASILRHRPSNPTPRRARRSVGSYGGAAAAATIPAQGKSNMAFTAHPHPPSPSRHHHHSFGHSCSSHSHSLFHFCRSPFRQIFLLLFLLFYQLAGALLFLICEAENQRQREAQWAEELNGKRHELLESFRANLANSSMANVDHKFAQQLQSSLLPALVSHDNMLLEWRGKHSEMRWDFWNAMLFSLSIFTTIGYGHLSARTVAGRLLTMLYALGGIPLLMMVLDELGRLLSRLLLNSWFLIKCACRRAFRSCTRQSWAEIRALDTEDQEDLRSSAELPLALVLIMLFSWICLCAILSCLWERKWDFPTAFYFFFTSLSTIGLGDVVPTQARYSLLMTAFIIVGLALVSMTIGLIQAKCTGGNNGIHNIHHNQHLDNNNNNFNGLTKCHQHSNGNNRKIQRNHCGSSLGVFSTTTSSSRCSGAIRDRLRERQWHSKCTQTLLSFPSPGDIRNCRMAKRSGEELTQSLSIDDVMRLVDTEEGDILLLAQLTLSRDVSGLTSGSGSSGLPRPNDAIGMSRSSTSSESARIWSSDYSMHTITSSGSDIGANGSAGEDAEAAATARSQHLVVSRSFDHCGSSYQQHLPFSSSSGSSSSASKGIPVPSSHRMFPPIDIPLVFPLFPSFFARPPNSMSDLELLEELEDRMLLSHGGNNGERAGGSSGINSNRGMTSNIFAANAQILGNVPMPTTETPTAAIPGAGVHFRSRLSLIPEQRSLDEEQEAMEHQAHLSTFSKPTEEEEMPKIVPPGFIVEEIGGGTTDSDSMTRKSVDVAVTRGDLERGPFIGGRRRKATTSSGSTSWSAGLSTLLKGEFWWNRRRREPNAVAREQQKGQKRSASNPN